MGKVMRHTLGASLNIRHNLSSSKGPKPLQLKLLTTYIPKTSAFTLAFSTSQRLRSFFSSRRRHTRYIGDWSSDVCSSDLRGGTIPSRPTRTAFCNWTSRCLARMACHWVNSQLRSEERRVGKECRARRMVDHLHTKDERL